MPGRPDLRVDWCSYEAAKYAVEHWHYSRSLPTPPLVKLGAWEDGAFIGCVIFSRGASNGIGKPFGLPQTSIAELTRIALAPHKTPVSRIMTIAVRMVRAESPGLRMLVSYADPSRYHHGGIYQAAGWTYIGKSAETTEYIAPDGKQWHGRMVSSSGAKKVYGVHRAMWRPEECTRVRMPGKHKYLYPLDAEMRAKIAPLALPYPKRAGSIASDASAFQAEEGGATPTPALQTLGDNDG